MLTAKHVNDKQESLVKEFAKTQINSGRTKVKSEIVWEFGSISKKIDGWPCVTASLSKRHKQCQSS